MLENPLDCFDNIVVTLSGSKDSTACLFWALEHFKHNKIRVMFEDSGVESPETKDYIKLINDNLIKVETIFTKSFWNWLREIGRWPASNFRWCTWRLKTEPTLAYLKDISNPLVIFGMRGLESGARSKCKALEYDPLYKCCRFHPVLDWDTKTVFNYIRAHNFPIHPAYSYTERISCWCCPLGDVAGLVKFTRIHPSVIAEGARIESEVGHTWNKGISLTDIIKIAESQQEMKFSIPNKLEILANTPTVSLSSFVFPVVTAWEIEQVIALKNPRGFSNQEEYSQIEMFKMKPYEQTKPKPKSKRKKQEMSM